MNGGSSSKIVVMGPSGSGKTVVGTALARRCGWTFYDADDLHPPINLAKMSSGIPLTDEDRAPWLRLVGGLLANTDRIVVACSALKSEYRRILRGKAGEVAFLLLDAPVELLGARLRERTEHFMPASLVESQLEALEPLGVEERGLTVDASQSLEEIVNEAVAWIRSGTPPAGSMTV